MSITMSKTPVWEISKLQFTLLPPLFILFKNVLIDCRVCSEKEMHGKSARPVISHAAMKPIK